MKRRLLLTAFSLIAGCLLTHGAAVRVATMDFDCDETDYASRAAAKDFSAALQAQLPKAANIEWVEREELALAAAELKLSLAFGTTDGAAARVGKWTKADLLVLGRFTRPELNKPVLQLEVLSLDHAEVLGEGSVKFTAEAGPTYRSLVSEAATAARALAALVQQTAAKHELGKTQTTAALLFFHTSIGPHVLEPMLREGLRRTIHAFSPALTRSVERAAASPDGFRLVQFRRPNRALEESELVISGLVESDPSAWLKVADYYIWGEITTAYPNSAPDRPLSERSVLVTIAVHVWDGRNEVKSFREDGLAIAPGGWDEHQIETVCERLVRSALPLRKPAATLEPNADARRHVAQMLADRAVRMSDFRFTPPPVRRPESPESRRWLGELIQTLELSCFFDPQDPVTNGKLAGTRWSEMLSRSAKDSFRFDWRSSEAWGHHVERFGLDTPFEVRLPMAMVSPMSGGVPWEYVRSAMTMAARFRSPDRVPGDLPPDVRDRWHEQMAAEFVKRAFAVVDRPEMSNRWAGVLYEGLARSARATIPDPRMRLKLIEAVWPRYVDSVKRTPNRALLPSIRLGITQTMADLGRAGEEKTWFDLIGSPVSDSSATPFPPEPRLQNPPDRGPFPNIERRSATARELPLTRPSDPLFPPRSEGRGSGNPSAPGWATASATSPTSEVPILRAPAFAALPPEFEVQPTLIRLPTDPDDKTFRGPMPIHALQFFHSQLWIAAAGEETIPTPEVNPDLNRELKSVLARRDRLWVYDPHSQRVEAAPASISTNSVTDVLAAGDQLWLAGDGVVSFNPETKQARRFGIADGLEVIDTFALAKAGGKIFTTGVQYQIAVHELAGERWQSLRLPLVGLGFASEGRRALAGAAGQLLFSAGNVLLQDLEKQTWANLAELSSISSACGDDTGLWLGGRNQLHFLNSANRRLSSWKPRLFPSWQDQALVGVGYGIVSPFTTPWVGSQRWLDDERIFWGLQRFQRERERAHAERQRGAREVDGLRLDTRLPSGEITALLSESEFLWLGCDAQDGPCVLVVHKPTFSWVGYLKVSAPVGCLAVSDDFLWIGLKSGAKRLLQVNKRFLFATPRIRWRKDEVPESEMADLLKRRPLREQASFAFFRGDYTQTVQLLERAASQPSDLEMLFLLAFSHDHLGIGKPEAARRYFADIASHYPDTPWARFARESMAGVHATPGSSKQLVQGTSVAKDQDPSSDPHLNSQINRIVDELDRDRDGKLSALELRFITSVIPTSLRARLAGAPMPPRLAIMEPLMSERLPPLDLMLLQHDTNLDNALDAAELSALAKALRKD